VNTAVFLNFARFPCTMPIEEVLRHLTDKNTMSKLKTGIGTVRVLNTQFPSRVDQGARGKGHLVPGIRINAIDAVLIGPDVTFHYVRQASDTTTPKMKLFAEYLSGLEANKKEILLVYRINRAWAYPKLILPIDGETAYVLDKGTNSLMLPYPAEKVLAHEGIAALVRR
jgi:hypothetical protein